MSSQKGKEAGPKTGVSKVKLTPCKACGDGIHFVETRNGRRMPCNQKKLTVITLLGDVVSGWEAHFSNCPGADKFRKKKEDGKKQSTAGV